MLIGKATVANIENGLNSKGQESHSSKELSGHAKDRGVWLRAQYLFRGRLLWLIAIILCSGIQSASAQKKHSPNDEYIETLVRKGTAYLEKNAQSDHGEATLAALTIVEAGKRFDREVPREHPLIQLAVKNILADLSNDGPGAGFGTYYNCLAIILLLEVNDREYQPQIEKLIEKLWEKQVSTGAFSYTKSSDSDTSQTQYAALAFAVLKLHGYKIYVDEAKAALNFFCDAQTQDGSWFYHTKNGRAAGPETELTLSLHVAGAGSVYILQDLLNLSPRVKNGGPTAKGGATQKIDTLLPPSVTIYVAKQGNADDPDAPLTDFDDGKLSSTKRAANTWFSNRFTVQIDKWNYYYLYGLERYAYFRTLAEGRMDIDDWYDQGVDYLASLQSNNGSWPAAGSSPESAHNSTCFAILFLVRSSEILMVDPSVTTVAGQKGFEENVKLSNENGVVVSDAVVRGVEDVMTALRNAKSEDDIDVLMPAIKQAVSDFAAKSDTTDAQQKSFLYGLITDEQWFRRKVGVKFLGAAQDLDNVPALLYALSDPVKEIRIEAHNGLRLISRKIDTYVLSEEASIPECLALKEKWTAWYLGLRPDAELFD